MIPVTKHFKGSFLPSKARKELVLFLWSIDDFRNKLIYEIAATRVYEIHSVTGIEDSPTQYEINEFIKNNYSQIISEAQSRLTTLAIHAIPGFDWLVIFKQIGLFAICVVPAISYLVKQVVCLPQSDKFELIAATTSLVFLSILIICVGVALIMDASQKS